MSQQRLVAKAALFDESGELLVLTRSESDAHRPGGFDFPGGCLDPGESIEQAMSRELKEELGVTPPESDLSLLYAATLAREDISYLRFLFVGRLSTDATITLSPEHSAFEWMPPDEAMNRYDHPVWIEGLRYVLERQLFRP